MTRARDAATNSHVTTYVHPTGAGNQHVPAAGATGQLLQYASAGTAAWATIETGTPAIVTPTFASPDATYTSSGTYSKPASVADTDLMWVFMVDGGGGGGGDASGDFFAVGGNGGKPLIMYGPAAAFHGATYVIGAGGAGGSTNSSASGGLSYITLSSANNSVRYDTHNNNNFMNFVSNDLNYVGGTTLSIQPTGGVVFALISTHSGWVTGQSNSAISSSTAYNNFATDGGYINAPQQAVWGGAGGGGYNRSYQNDSLGAGQSFISGNGGVGSLTAVGTAGSLHGGGGGAGRPNGGAGGSGSMRVYYV
jgi:hypothetical protein